MTKKLTVRCSNSTRPVLELLLPEFERTAACPVELVVDSTRNALERIQNGEVGDVAVLQDVSIATLADAGILDNASRRPFAASRIGLGCRAGAPRPDITSVGQFRSALLNASSIAHTEFGPSGRYFPQLAERLGLAEEMKRKTVTRPGGYIGYAVTEGQAELAFQQLCELMAVPGLDVIGPIPDELQHLVLTETAVFKEAPHPQLAKALMEFFARPANRGFFEQTGLDKLI